MLGFSKMSFGHEWSNTAEFVIKIKIYCRKAQNTHVEILLIFYLCLNEMKL